MKISLSLLLASEDLILFVRGAGIRRYRREPHTRAPHTRTRALSSSQNISEIFKSVRKMRGEIKGKGEGNACSRNVEVVLRVKFRWFFEGWIMVYDLEWV